MSSIAEVLTTQEPLHIEEARPERARSTLGYLRRNPSLGIGILFLGALLLLLVLLLTATRFIGIRPPREHTKPHTAHERAA